MIDVEHTVDLFGVTYYINSIVRHMGTSVTSGHYTTYVKRGDWWYYCNDANISKVNVLPNPSGDAYLLLYSRHTDL